MMESRLFLLVIGYLCIIESCTTKSNTPAPWTRREVDTVLESISTTLGVNEACYGRAVGCLSMGTPWYSFFRPLPKPQTPEEIDTRFYLYTRARLARYNVTTVPHVDVRGSGFDGGRGTFFIAHGFAHDGNHTWLSDMKNAILQEFDANVFLVDWGKGAVNMNYFQAASNIRIVAKEVIRLAKHLVSREGANVSRFHLIGHSLGAHALSYVAKEIPGVARLTALDPAQPAFEGYEADVRLDATDALFVDVIHTNARPFIPLVGFGMMAAHGHVDYYMNGGMDQPGCIVPSPKLFTFNQLAREHGEELLNYVACPHQRAYEYFTASIRDKNCTFWGRRLQDILFNKGCDLSNCIPLGLEAVKYPARGSFNVLTSYEEPYFCSPNKEADNLPKHLAELQRTMGPQAVIPAPQPQWFETRNLEEIFPWLKPK